MNFRAIAFSAALALGGASGAVAQSLSGDGFNLPVQQQLGTVGVDDGLQPAPGPAPTPNPTPAPPAASGLLASNPEAVFDAITALGWAAGLEMNEGKPAVITSRVSNTNIWIYFIDCNDAGADCWSIQFHTGYTMNAPVSLEKINEFNSKYWYVRSYTGADNTVFLRMELIMRHGGLAIDDFTAYLKVWEQLVKYWEETIGVA